jgi:GNAT superfamily N-acetyltransferase
MGSAVATRAATPRDLKTLIALCDALNAHLGMPTGRLEPKEFRAAIFGRNAFVFADVAEAPSQGAARAPIIGYAFSHDAFSTDFGERGMFLVDLYVEPEARRSGVGIALLRAIARRTKARGGSHVWWASATTNRQARRFYAASGASEERFCAHTLVGRAFEKLARR